MTDISDLFDEHPKSNNPQKTAGGNAHTSSNSADASIATTEQQFELIKKPAELFSSFPQEIPINDGYSKEALSYGASSEAAQLSRILASFLNATDPQDRTDARNRLIPAYWNFIISVAGRLRDPLPPPMQTLMRFGYLSHQLVKPSIIEVLQKVIRDKKTDEPIYYQDEWLIEIAKKNIKPTVMEEVSFKKLSEHERNTARAEKIQGLLKLKFQAAQSYSGRLDVLEEKLRASVEILSAREKPPELDGLRGPYTESQRRHLTEISSIIREMSTVTRQLQARNADFLKTKSQQRDLDEKTTDQPATIFESGAASSEMMLIQQMAKLSVGRSGNHFPFLFSQYLSNLELNGGFRENTLSILSGFEYLDSGMFLRTFRDITSRIVPYIILIPIYGNYGLCWEPFEQFNRASGRGRIVIPMYPQDLRVAIASALGDLRWQVAKEKSSRFWMEEGLTGWYYEYYTKNKLKGDIKTYFIQDYILWLLKESVGTQKLHKEVRDIFWRYIPFPPKLKDYLSKRGFVYGELSKKDKNRSMSSLY